MTSPHMPTQGLVGALWLAACLAVSYSAMSYDFKPGRIGPRRAAWPTEIDYSYSTVLLERPRKTTIVAFVHPRCVCTRATVHQLLGVLAAHPEVGLIVPVFTPPSQHDPQAWENSEYVQTIRAQRPDAQIVADEAGIQAWRFGALTSGTVLVYDPQGREVFRGGITDRRGGENDNPGLQQLARVLADQRTAPASLPPVFGCPLVAATGEQKEGNRP